MQADPAMGEELRRLGVPRPPAVVVGDRVVQGWNPEGVAKLVGVQWKAAAAFSPAELAAKLDAVLESAERLLARMSREHLDWVPPERKRTVRDLGHHVFRLSLACIDAIDRLELPETWFEEPAPGDLLDGAAVARYGALARARLGGWFAGAAPEEYDRIVQTYYGPQSGRDLLERTAWHAGQHLRQLYDLAGRLGVTPAAPLPDEAFRGLPLPVAIW